MTDMAANDGQETLFFINNGTYCEQTSGGEIHFFHMIEAAVAAGRPVDIFGGHALKKKIDRLFPRGIPVTLTDRSQVKPFAAHTLGGQFRLLLDYGRRFIGSLKQLHKIKPSDCVYAVSDYWFDVLPLILCKAESKILIWHMQAPSLGQVICRGRPDVDTLRIASLYYWASQNFSLWLFRFCRNKRMLMVHPTMRGQLLARGYRAAELTDISFGVDVEKAVAARGQNKIYDAVWIGRVHRQKGIDDLLATLAHLAGQIENFRAILIGDLRAELLPEIERRGLARCVEFSGFVSEAEKFRLFHASRVFLMTSQFEGSPRVIAEALVCQVPVVAYEVETYRPIFGDFLRYVPCFNLKSFQDEARLQIEQMRAGANYLTRMNLGDFSQIHSWSATAQVCLSAVEELGETQKKPERN